MDHFPGFFIVSRQTVNYNFAVYEGRSKRFEPKRLKRKGDK